MICDRFRKATAPNFPSVACFLELGNLKNNKSSTPQSACVGTLGNKAFYFVSGCIFHLVAVRERLFRPFFPWGLPTVRVAFVRVRAGAGGGGALGGRGGV